MISSVLLLILLHLFTQLTQRSGSPAWLCVCSLHSWCRFFPRCPLWLCCIYPVYYFCVCTDLEFHLLLTGMRFCSTTYKAVLVRVCLGLKNIPPPSAVYLQARASALHQGVCVLQVWAEPCPDISAPGLGYLLRQGEQWNFSA